MPGEKYVPVRKCIACRTCFPQSELLRIAVTADGLQFDKDRRLPGRGVYLCRKESCVKTAFDKNSFAKSLRRSVPKEELARLREDLNNNY